MKLKSDFDKFMDGKGKITERIKEDCRKLKNSARFRKKKNQLDRADTKSDTVAAEPDFFDVFKENFNKFWSAVTYHRVDKKVYFLLSLFFGAMGIHRFYARHFFSGIVYFSLFMVGFLFMFVHRVGVVIIIPLELIALLQGVWALCKRKGADGLIEI